jgi:uncharacterized protein DUF3311
VPGRIAALIFAAPALVFGAPQRYACSTASTGRSRVEHGARKQLCFRRARVEDAMEPAPHKRDGWSAWYLLFVVQFVAVLWPPFYNRAQPDFFGVPFFYWYQLLWVIVGAVFTIVVYFATRGRFREPPRPD